MNIKNNGQRLKSKTKLILTSLLNRAPSESSTTLLTTLIYAKKIATQAGKNAIIFTGDHKLYRAFVGCNGSRVLLEVLGY